MTKTPEQVTAKAAEHAKRIVALKWASPKCETAIAGAWEAGYVFACMDNRKPESPSPSVPIDQEKNFLPVLKENLEAMKHAKEMGWTDVLISEDPFDCVIETYEDLIEIYKSKSPSQPSWVSVLKELVELKDTEEAIEKTNGEIEWYPGYLKRKPLAWAAARELLKSVKQ